jgi:hypothetical protein
MSYRDALQNWHDFYVTAGAAAATLVGLLFVGLSLHIRAVVSHSDIRSLARVTLTDFFVVLLVALLVLAPMSDQGTAAWLIAVAAVSLGLVVRPAVQGLRMRRTRTLGFWVLISRFGLSALCFVGVAAMGVLVGRRDFDHGLGGLLVVVVFLLVIAVRNTWDLLVTVADRPDAGTEFR